VASPICVSSGHGCSKGIRLGAGVRGLEGVEVGGLDYDVDVGGFWKEAFEESAGDLGGDLVVSHACIGDLWLNCIKSSERGRKG
jgi:hypothetical protein